MPISFVSLSWVCFFLVLGVSALAFGVTDGETIEGIYYCQTPKAEYCATIKKVNDVYIVQWSTGAEGIGIKDGNRFSVSWFEGSISGITIYSIRGQTLHGRGTLLPGNGRMGSEEMTLLRRFRQ